VVNWLAQLAVDSAHTNGHKYGYGLQFLAATGTARIYAKICFFFALAIFSTTINQKSSDILNGEAQQYTKKRREKL